MKHVTRIFSLIATIGLLTFTGCDDDEAPGALEIVSVTSTGTDIATGATTTVDLNTATTPTNVQPDGVVTITFSKPVDAATVTSSTVAINKGSSAVASTVAVNGNTVTITPTNNLTRGTAHTIIVSGSVKASDGGTSAEASRSFTTAGNAPPDVQADKLVVYIPFEGDVVDEKGHATLNEDITYAADRFGNVEASANFNGTTNYVGIAYGADLSNANTTVSYWVKFPSSAAHSAHIGTTAADNIKQFVTFSIGGNDGTFHQWSRFTCCDLGFDIDVLTYYTNHVNSGNASAFAGSNIEMKNEGNPQPTGPRVVEINNPNWVEDNTGVWMHIVTSWNAAARRKSFYINGVPSTVYELAPSAEYALDAAVINTTAIDAAIDNSKNLYLGSGVPFWATKTATGITPFRSGIPFAFKGQMDDFRMYSVALTNAEVLSLYNAEKPQ